MKLLIDIGHPAHVHYFRNLYFILKDKGHSILITSRNKDVALELLNEYNMPYIPRGKGGKTLLSKVFYMVKANFMMLQIAMRFRPDLLMSFSTVYPAHVAFLIRKPYLGITDTEQSREQQMLFVPFSKYVITPKCFNGDFGKKHFRFNSYMELAYLHPLHFKPDKSVLKMLDVDYGERYAIVRFVSWDASHDKGHKGLTLDNKIRLINKLSNYGKVFISSEGALPKEMESYRIKLKPTYLHHAMYYATLVYGESATMASEAAVMGTFSIFHNNNRLGYLTEQEKFYGHVINLSESKDDQAKGINKALEIMADPASKKKAIAAAEKLIKDKISTTEYLVKFIETNLIKQ